MLRVIAALMLVVFGSTGASAESASLVQGYNGISVAMSRDAATWGLKRADT